MRLKLDSTITANVAGTQIELTHLANLDVRLQPEQQTAYIAWETGTLNTDGVFNRFSRGAMTLADYTEELEDGSTVEHTEYSDLASDIDAASDTEQAVWEHIGKVNTELQGVVQ